MPRFSSKNKYYDEISDMRDIGGMVCALLRDSTVSDELWEIFEDLIRSEELEGLVAVEEWWWKEQQT